MIFRIILVLIMIFSAFILPWWISVLFAIFGLLKFKDFYEMILVGIILDSLYGFVFTILGFEFVFTLFFIIIFYIISTFKNKFLL